MCSFSLSCLCGKHFASLLPHFYSVELLIKMTFMVLLVVICKPTLTLDARMDIFQCMESLNEVRALEATPQILISGPEV